MMSNIFAVVLAIAMIIYWVGLMCAMMALFKNQNNPEIRDASGFQIVFWVVAWPLWAFRRGGN